MLAIDPVDVLTIAPMNPAADEARAETDRSAGRWCYHCHAFGNHHTDRHGDFVQAKTIGSVGSVPPTPAALPPHGTSPRSGTPCDTCGQIHTRCAGHRKSDHTPCTQWPIRGGTVCRKHGGSAPQVRRAATRNLAEATAARRLSEVGVTAIDNPLEELAAVAAEARAWQQQVGSMLDALGTEWTSWGESGESLRALVPLFERAMDRCERMLATWVRLGFDERMVGLHERQAELVAGLLRAVLDDPELGLTDVQRVVAPVVVGRHLELVKAA